MQPLFALPLFRMSYKKKASSAEAEQTATTAVAPEGKRSPIKVIVVDDVSASIFAREYPVKGTMRTFYSVSFSRSYRDAGGTWRYVKSFNLEDLGKVVSVCQQADEYVRGLPDAA
jgi:hypothetical protein